jgi:hypothetical protein
MSSVPTANLSQIDVAQLTRPVPATLNLDVRIG